MRVSVIIPTYNSGPLVVEAVESALAQTAPPHEVIVVDDGSTDDTADRLTRFGDRIRYVRQTNARVAAARNNGVRTATGDAVAFLDADDVWHPEKLARQVAALDADPDLGLVGTDVFPWPGGLPDPPVASAVTRYTTDAMLPNNPITTSSVLVRRAVLDRAGEFDRQLFGPEDYDLWLRCSRVAGVGILGCQLTGYREVAGSVGKQADTMHAGLVRIHAKLGEAGAWAGRPWFRRKCQAHAEFTTAYLHHASGRPARAATLLVRSLCTYPAPLQPPDVKYRFARLRLLARSLGAAVSRSLRTPAVSRA